MSLLNYTTSFTATPNPIPFYQPPPSVTFNPPLQGYQPSYPPYQPNEDPQNIAQNPPNHPNNPYYNSYPQQINHQAPRQTAQFTSRQSHQTAPQNIPNNTPQNYAPNTPQNIPQATLQNSAQYKPQNGVHQGPQVSPFPDKPPGFTRVEGGQLGGPGTKTQIHAVVDYDDDFGDYDYEDDKKTPVTPIQGPIFIKNGSVPVVPLYSYPVLNNGTFVQIPILWTALSVALGLEIRGEIIRGVPCIKRYHQLFCPTAGNSYPLDRIEEFIDENKALMKRMYGDFQMTPEYGPGPGGGDNRNSGRKAKRNVKAKPGVPDLHADPGVEPEHINLGGDSFFAKVRRPRQSFRNNQSSERVDACESKTEIVTPYWASNSAGKIRAIVNTQHFEQAIHQEVCKMVRTNRCSGDCGCEQKYKWHRLLAYDPDNDCKGIFMDWFLFPSCCVCRCNPT